MKENSIYTLVFIVLIAVTSCTGHESRANQTKKITTQEIDSLYVLNKDFDVSDVRRYGVFPEKSIGGHPKLKKNKIDVLLDLSENGLELTFPEGIYKTALVIENREDIALKFQEATFTGSVQIKESDDIKLKGNLTSLVEFYTKNAQNISVDNLFLKSDTVNSINKRRNLGCSIHSGTKNISFKKLIVDDLVSGKEFKYVKAAVAVHGHNNEPKDVFIDSLIINSSDRHGVYLTGDNINIKYLEVNKFGIGSSDNMAPMEGGIAGEQKEFSGLWIKNAHESNIQKAVINIQNSKGKYSTNFDIGDTYLPFKIDTLIIRGKGESSEKSMKYTAVEVGEKYIEND